MRKTKVAVIGSGPGGLSAAMILAHQGFEVDVYEKGPEVGGRNAALRMGGYTFDVGPTFLMLPQLLEELFQQTGRKLSDYLDMRRVDPMYRLRFEGTKDFFPTNDRRRMFDEIERVFPGDGINYERFLEKEASKFDYVYPCLESPYSSWTAHLKPQFLKALPHLDFRASLHERLQSYFKHPELQLAMTFQAKYLGMSPWKCPATFTIISFIEHKWGIWHPIGGLNAIPAAMARAVRESGGRIHLNTPVKQVLVENRKATGLLLANGEKVSADKLVINADFAHAMKTLVRPEDRRKWTDRKLEKAEYSCSTFMLYLGVKRRYDIPHHNIIFAGDYRKNVSEIAETRRLSSDPSIYIQNAGATDPTLAPEGKSALYVLVPVPNQTSGIDWEKEKAGFRQRVLKAIERKTELKDLSSQIEVEQMVTPADWERRGVYQGATFNLSHKVSQMLYLRPRNRFEEFGNTYLVGGGTHPGSGLPTILQSGKISAGLLVEDVARERGRVPARRVVPAAEPELKVGLGA